MKESDFKGVILFEKGALFFAVTGCMTIIFSIIFAVSGYISILCLAFLSFIIFLWLTWFFRNPSRECRKGKDLVISPADGRVVLIETNLSDSLFNEHVVKVAIFLSLFNVHVNRIPVSGKIFDVSVEKGLFLPAFEKKAGENNFKKSILIKNDNISVKVNQIAGIVARRIICSLEKDDKVVQGDPYGMILFGSRVEIIIPSTVELKVKTGDRVKAGVTVIGELKK
ncbi:phosphatidylserine decarboxylase [bacterium]|nr:phosphatidylserine decarboxylase [bacterium]